MTINDNNCTQFGQFFYGDNFYVTIREKEKQKKAKAKKKNKSAKDEDKVSRDDLSIGVTMHTHFSYSMYM